MSLNRPIWTNYLGSTFPFPCNILYNIRRHLQSNSFVLHNQSWHELQRQQSGSRTRTYGLRGHRYCTSSLSDSFWRPGWNFQVREKFCIWQKSERQDQKGASESRASVTYSEKPKVEWKVTLCIAPISELNIELCADFILKLDYSFLRCLLWYFLIQWAAGFTYANRTLMLAYLVA